LCDDNKNELAEISACLKEYFAGAEYSAFCFDEPQAALDFLRGGGQIDAAVLDILMPDMSGIELAENFRALGYEGRIVFLTTVNDYASQSYGVRAFDYLLKPVSAGLVAKLMDRLIGNGGDNGDSDDESFILKIKTETLRVKYRELVYVEVMRHNLYFHFDGGRTVAVYAALKEYAGELLGNGRMIKANNSFIINIDYISAFETNFVIMKGGVKISITGSLKTFKNICYGRMFGGKGK